MTSFDPESVLDQFAVDETTDSDGLCAAIVALIRLRNAVDHRLAIATALAEASGVPRRRGMKSMARILMEEGAAPHIAYRALRIGRMLGELPTVADHAAAGALSAEHVDSIVKGLSHIQDRVDLSPEQRDNIITTLTSQAFVATPKDVSTKARDLAISLAPEDTHVSVAEDMALNEMSLAQGDDGRFAGAFDLDVVTAAQLMTALDPLSRPMPGADGGPDPRSMAKRRADALGQMVSAYLKSGNRPEQGGSKPDLLLVVPIGALATTHTGDGPAEVAQMNWAGPLSPALTATLACDSVVTRILVDSESVPLNIGTTKRVVPAGIRKAVIARDLGCIKCGRPATWCDVHHIRHWADGGETSLDNSALLCREDHTLLHHHGWDVVMGADGHPWLKPPADAVSQELIPSFHRRQSRPASHIVA